MAAVLVAAVVAAGAAAVAAAGPARADRTSWVWARQVGAPAAAIVVADDAPGALPATFTPLLLSAHVPERLVLSLPCEPSTVTGRIVATTRRPSVPGAVEVVADGGALTVIVDGAAEVRVPRGPSGCRATFDLEVVGGGAARWNLDVDGRATAAGVAAAPVLSGLFVADDVAAGVQATVVTAASSTRPSTRQWIAIVVSLLASALALGSAGRVAPSASTATPAISRTSATSATTARRATDTVIDVSVVAALVLWGLLGPWYFDDGWLMATVRARAGSGSFSNYFDTLATQMPLGFAHHVLLWPFAAIDAPFLLWRVVPVGACIGSWFVLRRLVGRLVAAGDQAEVARPATLALPATLAVAHLVASVAFLVTLRPEPVVAFLSLVVLDRTLTFIGGGSLRTFGAAIVLAAVACTLHPSGCVVLAGLVPAVPETWRVLRARSGVLAAHLAMWLCGAAAGTLLLVADTDLVHWRRARAAFAADGFHDNGPFDDLDRYRDLLANGTMAMLAFVLLGALVIVSWAVAAAADVRGRSTRSPHEWRAARLGDVSLVPGSVLVVAVGLLALTPSKWIYHFGSLAGFVVLGAAVELNRPVRGRRWLRPVALAIAACLLGRRAFEHPKDAQYFLALGRPDVGPLDGPLPWVLLGVLAVGVASLRPRRLRSRSIAPAWPVIVVLAVVLGATTWTAVLTPVVDGPAWSAPRAPLDDLAGGGCPFARSIDVMDPRAARPLAATTGPDAVAPARSTGATADDAPEGFGGAARLAGGDGPGARSSWFAVPAAEPATDPAADPAASPGAVVIAVRGAPGGSLVRVAWATDTAIVRVDERIVPPRSPSVYGPAPAWHHLRLLPSGDAAPSGATRLRVELPPGAPSSTGDVSAVVVAGPVVAPTRSLASVLDGAEVLVSPPVLPLLRCTTPPLVAAGVAAVPDAVIGFELHERVVEIPELGSPTGPWYLAQDAVRMRALVAWLTDDHTFAVTIRDEPETPPRTGG